MSEEVNEIKISLDSEKTLEDYLFSKMEDGLCPITDSDVSKVVRQFKVKGYGVIDLMTFFHCVDKSGNRKGHDEINVYELKKGALDKDAFCQIARYKRAFDRCVEEGQWGPADVYFHLVGATLITNDDTCYLADACEDWLSVWTYSVSLDSGISFERSNGWRSVKEDISTIPNAIREIIKEIECSSQEDAA